MPPSDTLSGTEPDPNGLGSVVSDISSGTQKRVKAAFVAVATELEQGERAEAVVCGEYLGHEAVAVLTDRRLVLANGRTYAPEIETFDLSAVTDVKGWADGGRATLRFTASDSTAVIGQIREVEAAQAFAGALRAKM